MSTYDLLSLYPNILKRAKLWEYQFNEVLYYGSGNASGRIRFTNNHEPNKTDVSFKHFKKLLANVSIVNEMGF